MERRKKTKELSEDWRNQIVRKHEQSQGYKSISKDLNVPVSTVRSVIKKCKAHGTVANLPRCGRKRKIDKRFQRKIVRMLDKEPRLTSKQVQAALQSEGTTVSARTIRRRLNEKGLYVQRSVYKDLVKFLQNDKFLSEAQLKRKGEFTFENDSLVEGGQMNELHNGTTFQEVRQYRSGHHLVRFYFLTRVYSAYLESILSDFKSGPQPDVLILNSCIWDLTRYNDPQLEGYKTNLDHLFLSLKEVLSPQCLIMWSMTMPVGFRNCEIPENTVHNLREDMVEGNFFSATMADFHKLDVLDMHYHFRCDLHLRCRDGIHWNQVAHRKYTQILLTHIALAWGVEPPKGVMPEGITYMPGFTSFDDRYISMSGVLYPRYYGNEMCINSEAVSPFVTDSPLLSTNITPGYFRPPPGNGPTVGDYKISGCCSAENKYLILC
ncbi:unnamed protein product [Ranitomeya imitator]|uniref:Transposase n=1 Tax=Ranitomeya imitator TaxID=111125 RepID=A0ABN9KYX5_9NEOB|nr:unnamed protein product [Ranitomeya imitator]